MVLLLANWKSEIKYYNDLDKSFIALEFVT